MAIDNVVGCLLRIPIFATLKPLQITEVARQAERCSFRRGDLIIKSGTPGEAAYLILSGDAQRRPESGSRAASEPIEVGSLVGELAMLVPHTYASTVVASDRVDCLELTRKALRDQMRADPELAERLAGFIRDRLALIACELRSIDRLLAGGEWPLVAGTGIRPPAMPALLPQSRKMKSAQPRGRSWAQEARHAHSARREAGT